MEGVSDYGNKFSNACFRIRAGIFYDFLKEKKKVVRSIRFEFHGVFFFFNGISENISKNCCRVSPLGVIFEKMKIIQRISPCLFYDKLPVLVGMGEFFQKDVQSVHDAIIFGHDILQGCIFLIYLDFNMICGYICFKGCGLFQILFPFQNDQGIYCQSRHFAIQLVRIGSSELNTPDLPIPTGIFSVKE